MDAKEAIARFFCEKARYTTGQSFAVELIAGQRGRAPLEGQQWAGAALNTLSEQRAHYLTRGRGWAACGFDDTAGVCLSSSPPNKNAAPQGGGSSQRL